MRIIRDRFNAVPEAKTRILVTHHPLFAMPIGEEEGLTKRVGRHEDALLAVADAGVHLLLAGHFPRSYVRSTRAMVDNTGPALVLPAGPPNPPRTRPADV